MAKFHHTITASNITVLAGGQVIQIPSTHAGFAALAAHLQEPSHDLDTIRQLADKREALARLTAGQVTVMGSTVYYRGVPIRSALSNRLIELTDSGYDATPWALFMDKVMQNPSENSRERLFEFLDRWKAPLTPDGNFVAFKGVKEDYSSTRTRPDGTKVYNRPGDTVEMPREEVVEDPNVTCASGLHACASHYLDCFWGTQNKVLALEINPADVVSIPTDYNLSKMRVCRYTVIGDVEDERHRDRIEHAQVIDQNENGRVVPVEPAPLVLKQEQRIDEMRDETFTYEGQTYVGTEEDFDEGDIVVCNDTGLTGRVLERGEIDYRDDDHPEHDEWQNGDVAGSDLDDYQIAVVALEDGTEKTWVWRDGDQWPGDRLELVEDEDEPEVDLGDDVLTFDHEQTGRSFTAPQLLASVRELGQRGFARKYGVPRTTLQDWLRRAAEAGY
jgi:hypothetical protein